MIISWQSDIVNTKESVLSACNKYHNRNKKTTERVGWRFGKLCIIIHHRNNDCLLKVIIVVNKSTLTCNSNIIIEYKHYTTQVKISH